MITNDHRGRWAASVRLFRPALPEGPRLSYPEVGRLFQHYVVLTIADAYISRIHLELARDTQVGTEAGHEVAVPRHYKELMQFLYDSRYVGVRLKGT
jgi:hypothetical protein